MQPQIIENGGYFEDERGKIWTTFSSKSTKLNHIKVTTNHQDTFRGFHGDAKTEKYTSCISGETDVFIICPKNLNYWNFRLVAEKAQTLYIPKDFYHGYHSKQESTYLYQLCYEGEYIDQTQQKTLFLENSCLPESIKANLLADKNLIRSKRDIKP
ncbi:dTDP-4-dehydrorhamnose 3,5-epimerase family protein [Synechococcus sp. YX-04-1]|uniref:dTDP-4-dehydrorhamnose 3,5-epimerase family protein n=1 Tax=Synechococcus sp. YX-04-1 TaxID=3062778 RepID=UPI0034C626E5